MKKATSIFLAAIMLLSLAACGSNDVSGLGKLDMEPSSASDGIGTLGQPSPGSQSSDPAPTTTTPEPVPSTPEPAPQPQKLETDSFSCELFSCVAPKGWNVDWRTIDAGGGVTRLMVFITDPADPNNVIFYIQALEPFFTDVESKNALCPYLDSMFEWSPVLTDGVNAEGVLRQWGSIYTLLDAQNYSDVIRVKNYFLLNVLDNYSADDGSQDIHTAVLAEVSVPGAATSYAMFFEDILKQASAYSVNYYISYSNLGFVIDPDLYTTDLDTFVACKNSFDFSGFLSKYSASADSGDTGISESVEYVPFA